MELLIDRLQAADQFQGLTLEALRGLARTAKAHLCFELVPREGGYVLRYDLKRTFGIPASGWLIAERSREVRRFATVEAAVVVARKLGLRELRVRLALDVAVQ